MRNYPVLLFFVLLGPWLGWPSALVAQTEDAATTQQKATKSSAAYWKPYLEERANGRDSTAAQVEAAEAARPKTSKEYWKIYWEGVDAYWKDLGSEIAGPTKRETPNEARKGKPGYHERTIETRIDAVFGLVLQVVMWIPFYNLMNVTLLWGQVPPNLNIPLVVLWLVAAAVFFTVRMGFVNLRLFGHAIAVVRGKYTSPDSHGEGEVSHFQALASALSATVGLGNIAGVAIAIALGGPGATIWMIVAGLLGMTLKFTECTLGQKFRIVDEHGRVSGGPMHYLKEGLGNLGMPGLGAFLAGFFMIFCVGGSLAGGCAFQVRQSLDLLEGQVPFFKSNGWAYGVIMASVVGIVILGGFRRIAQTAEKIVPTMCLMYLTGALLMILANITMVPRALMTMVEHAFGDGRAVYGGLVGALVLGFKRAAFSNEAGVGSASIAHSAAKTDYPVREGIVALLEPFIDTVVVCTMTALVIVISGVWIDIDPSAAGSYGGASITRDAFNTVGFMRGWFPWVLLVASVLFAFSTMISWSYYGERCWSKMFGPGSSLAYKMVFLVFVVLGSITSALNVLNFGDIMILSMAFPNIFGLYFLGSIVRKELREYLAKKHAGEFQTY